MSGNRGLGWLILEWLAPDRITERELRQTREQARKLAEALRPFTEVGAWTIHGCWAEGSVYRGKRISSLAWVCEGARFALREYEKAKP